MVYDNVFIVFPPFDLLDAALISLAILNMFISFPPSVVAMLTCIASIISRDVFEAVETDALAAALIVVLMIILLVGPLP